MVEQTRLLAAYERTRGDLLAERASEGHWVGEVSPSALSTATAVSALALVERYDPTDARSGRFVDESRESLLSDYIVAGLRWLAEHQNEDGGWGDTDQSHSNIATTMLAVAAFHLTGVPADRADLLERADRYIKSQGGTVGLRRRYGKDKSLTVPILANCAFADLVPWKDVPALPFELVCLPKSLAGWARLPVVRYAIPAFVAVGQARYFRRRPRNPLRRLWRAAAVEPSLDKLLEMLPASGGYLQSIPLTSFVVMSLAGTKRATHPVTLRGVDFLLASARPDGSWPIDTNLATWVTTSAVNALSTGSNNDGLHEVDCLDWLLRCQQTSTHPLTGAEPGGWAWTDLSGAAPDADDTAGALLALDAWRRAGLCGEEQLNQILIAAQRGANWLLLRQNANGGWPTFCRGRGNRPFDQSAVDITAHVLRALHVWRDVLGTAEISPAISRGLGYLAQQQQTDGSWVPLWFGNQDRPDETNRVYVTAKAVMAYRDLGWLDADQPRRALAWLRRAQNVDGGWSGGYASQPSGKETVGTSSVQETSLAVEALLAAHDDPAWQITIDRGLDWLIGAVESQQHASAAPLGLCFTRMWYSERLYPLAAAASALGKAIEHRVPDLDRPAAESHVLTH